MGLGRTLAALPAIAALVLLGCSKPEPSKAGRPQLTAGGITWRILGGTWKNDGDALVGSGGNIQSVTDLKDGTLEMDVEELGTGGRTIGIGFRYLLVDDDPARSSGYGLNLSGAAFNVFRGANNYWLPLNPETKGFVPSSIIDPKKNHIVLRMKGGSFEIDANGAALTNFTDAAYPHGHVNLWVESTVQLVRFSNIHLRP